MGNNRKLERNPIRVFDDSERYRNDQAAKSASGVSNQRRHSDSPQTKDSASKASRAGNKPARRSESRQLDSGYIPEVIGGLVVTRRDGESIVLYTGDGPITITVMKPCAFTAKLRIVAPDNVVILRDELLTRERDEY